MTVMDPREGMLGWRDKEGGWGSRPGVAPAEVWRGGGCMEGDLADKQHGPENTQERLGERFTRAGVSPSSCSLIFFIPLASPLATCPSFSTLPTSPSYISSLLEWREDVATLEELPGRLEETRPVALGLKKLFQNSTCDIRTTRVVEEARWSSSLATASPWPSLLHPLPLQRLEQT